MKRRSILFFLLAVLTVSFTSCSRAKPDPGHVIVLNKRPILFGSEGIDPNPVLDGSTWIALTTTEMDFAVTPVTITEEFHDLIPADKTPVTFSAYIKLQVIKEKTPILLAKFQTDWYNNNVRTVFRTIVRDKACVYSMNQLTAERDISVKLQQEIFKYMDAYVKKIGLPVIVLEVTIGAATPPEKVLEETKNIAAQNTRQLTELARAKTEGIRKDAEIKKAEADRAYMQNSGMSIDQYLRLRTIEVNKEQVELIGLDKNNISVILNSAGVPSTLPLR